ncbi:MAG: helix-turn-helix transcriptional regulator [Endomicrobium sp.]|jgi:y4mF family transcriptional regulator|nr:helix-turn-helix transcriptional regulator [Endomicrobium sp.]
MLTSLNPSPNPGPYGPANVTLDPQTYSNFKLKGQLFPSGKFHKKIIYNMTSFSRAGNLEDVMLITKPNEIGKIIKELRVRQKINQSQLAAVAGVGVRFIVDLEKGKETASLGKTLKVISMLGIEINLKIPEID